MKFNGLRRSCFLCMEIKKACFDRRPSSNFDENEFKELFVLHVTALNFRSFGFADEIKYRRKNSPVDFNRFYFS